jgi:hypothetical protein
MPTLLALAFMVQAAARLAKRLPVAYVGCDLDPACAASYIARHDDAFRSAKSPPPPCLHGTGAHPRLIVTPVPPDEAAARFTSLKSAWLATVR